MYSAPRKQGFTLVELLIVIVVIAILATISVTIYKNAQVQARDTQVVAAVDKASDALALYISQRNGTVPNAGWLSTTPIGAGPECVGWGGGGWFATGAYPCTLEDVLVLNGYLPAGFSASIPQSSLDPAATYNKSIMIDSTNNTTRTYMVWWRLEDPGPNARAAIDAQITKCGLNAAAVLNQRDFQGMTNAKCVGY